jgi:hypothetical protein
MSAAVDSFGSTSGQQGSRVAQFCGHSNRWVWHAPPAFQLDPPCLPEPDPEQASLFSPAGAPMDDWLDALAVRKRVDALLAAARVPGSHRRGYAQHLCDGALIDPGLVLWLGTPGRLRRWRDQIDSLGAESGALVAVRDRARALLDYAMAMRNWPRAALLALKRQRPSGRAFDVAMFPPLPQRLGEWRHALLAVAMQARALLYAAFANPTRIEHGVGYCVVEVLGAFRLNFDWQQRFITVSQRHVSDYVCVRYAQADLLAPLPSDDWCLPFAYRLRQDLRTALGWAWAHEDIEGPAFTWLTEVVKQIARQSCLLDHVRAHIREAYPTDRRVLHDLRTCTIGLWRGRGVRSGHYIWAWRHADLLRQRAEEAPRLAPLWGFAVSLKLIGVRDDFHMLRRRLAESGVTTAGWKLLCRGSRAVYRPFNGMGTNPENTWENLIAYVRLLQRAQATEPMPACFVRALFARHWYVETLDVAALPLGLVRGAIAQIRRTLPLGELDAYLEHELTPVLGWIARTKPVFDSNQQRAPWRWFHARYLAWCEKKRQTVHKVDWAHGIDGLRWRGFDVVPLRDSTTLWQEGETMRTCLHTYVEGCASRAYIIYSIRAGNRPRPVAHVGLHLLADGTAKLDQVKGFANSAVEPALLEFAKRLARCRHAE